eukprot:TRINITY_DN2780_c0_g1_i1.p1 TRINITY_DN2780_c0_g1~~TRINITY_DN2780_c0_g1_i1.p1  ORF type:complete len:345 (+),score=48.88 TRINITY_DN2780_c0_g1_i1:31-1035(+)
MPNQPHRPNVAQNPPSTVRGGGSAKITIANTTCRTEEKTQSSAIWNREMTGSAETHVLGGEEKTKSGNTTIGDSTNCQNTPHTTEVGGRGGEKGSGRSSSSSSSTLGNNQSSRMKSVCTIANPSCRCTPTSEAIEVGGGEAGEKGESKHGASHLNALAAAKGERCHDWSWVNDTLSSEQKDKLPTILRAIGHGYATLMLVDMPLRLAGSVFGKSAGCLRFRLFDHFLYTFFWCNETCDGLTFTSLLRRVAWGCMPDQFWFVRTNDGDDVSDGMVDHDTPVFSDCDLISPEYLQQDYVFRIYLAEPVRRPKPMEVVIPTSNGAIAGTTLRRRRRS